MNHLRHLDIDDLLILRYLLSDLSLTAIAQALNISQPAVTQRLHKMEDVFEVILLEKKGYRVFLTKQARQIAEKAHQSLMTLENKSREDPFITIGTRELSAKNILWPTLKELLQIKSLPPFHIAVKATDELDRALEDREVDCTLTSSPKAYRDDNVFHISEESYCLVGHRELENQWKHKRDLTLLEINKSLPFLYYLKSDTRATLAFTHYHYLGSLELILSATVEKMGFAIIPFGMAKKFVEKSPCQIYLGNKHFQKDEFKVVAPRNSIHLSYIKNLLPYLRKNTD